MRQVNPFNVIAFTLNDADHLHRGYVHSPVSILPPFQLFVTDDSETVASWTLRNVDNGVESAQTLAQITVDVVTGYGAFFTYNGVSLGNAPIPGIYQIIVTMTGGDVYYSQRVFMSRIFDTFGALSLVFNDGDCVTDGGGTNFILPFTATFPTWGVNRVLLDVDDTGNFVFISSLDTFTLTQALLSEFGGAPVIRIETTAVLPNEPGAVNSVYRDYVFTYAEGFPCDGVLTARGTAVSSYAQDAYVLTFSNATDLQDLNLLYQQGYEQKFYFFGYRLEHVPIIEQAFEQNGVGERFLAQATNREQIAFDFWPMPDYLQAVLQAADQHGTATIATVGGTDTAVYEIGCERKDVQGAICPAGVLRFTNGPVAVQGCEADFTLV